MPLRIVLADDHPIVRQGVRLLLEREGFQIVGEATDGREAVQRARHTTPDVLVLDVTMPHLPLKTQAAEDLVLAIHDVVRGKVFFSPAVASVVVDGYLSRGLIVA